MKKIFVLLCCLLASSHLYAEKYDIGQTMKSMKGEFLLSIRAKDLPSIKTHLAELKQWVDIAHTLRFPEEKKALFLQGLNKVAVVVDEAQAQADAGQMKQAQETLKQVDDLRVEYHDQRNESIWKRFFG